MTDRMRCIGPGKYLGHESTTLEGRRIERHYGGVVGTVPTLLARCNQNEGIIPSEATMRKLGIRNFERDLEFLNSSWDTSTLSATRGENVKVILPYEKDSRTLTEAARFGLGLINADEDLVNKGVNLDINGRWEKLEGSGVYTRKRNDWFVGDLVGLDSDMTKEQAMKCPILLTKLGHPDYVDTKFARSTDEVAEIIGKTFELGEQKRGVKTMMGQYLSDISDKGVLKMWVLKDLYLRVRSGAGYRLDGAEGLIAFEK